MFSRRNASAFAAKGGREKAPVSGGHRVASGRPGSWAPASQVGSFIGLTPAFAANAGLTLRSARVGSRKGAFWLSERGGFCLTVNSLSDRRGAACVRDFPLLAGRLAPEKQSGSFGKRAMAPLLLSDAFAAEMGEHTRRLERLTTETRALVVQGGAWENREALLAKTELARTALEAAGADTEAAAARACAALGVAEHAGDTADLVRSMLGILDKVAAGFYRLHATLVGMQQLARDEALCEAEERALPAPDA